MPTMYVQIPMVDPLMQRRCDLVHQVALSKGFPKDTPFAEFLQDVYIAMASDDDDRQSGPCGVDGFSEFNAIHFRHSEICKNEVDLKVVCNQPKRFLSTLGCECCISERSEHPQGGLEYHLIVVDDEDTQLPPHPRALLGNIQIPFLISCSDLGARQEDRHRSALADACLDPDAATRLFGETEDLRQSEARTFPPFFRRKEGFEHVREHIVRNTDAGVADGQTDIVSQRGPFQPQGLAFYGDSAGFESQGTA